MAWTNIGSLKGPKGDKGDTGAKGADGTSVTAGTGAPTGTAVVGSVYIDASTGNLYIYKA